LAAAEGLRVKSDRPSPRSSLTGIIGLVALAKETVKLATEKGFVHLAEKGSRLIDDAKLAPTLPIAHPDRNGIMSRLSVYQLDAMRAFIAGQDISPPKENS
jgi:hypothetical protein